MVKALLIHRPVNTAVFVDKWGVDANRFHALYLQCGPTLPNFTYMTMQPFKLFLKGPQARKVIKEGIIEAAGYIAPTLGVKGRKIVLDKEFGALEIIDDGARILDKIEMEDTQKQIGVKMLREVAKKTNDKVGDGTTTSSVLTAALVDGLVKDYDPMDIKQEVGNILKTKKELKSGIEKVIKFIDEHKVDIDNKRVLEIGTVSSNNKEIGEILAELFGKLGREAAIIVSSGQGMKTTSEVVEGMTINKGYASPFFITDEKKLEAVITDASILVTDCKLQNPVDAEELLLFCQQKLLPKHIFDLVVIADEITGMPLDFLVNNKLNGRMRIVAVKAPAVGDYQDLLKDIAIVSGAQIISKDLGKGLKDITPEMLGKADKVIVTQNETTIVGGKGDKEKIQERIQTLENQIEQSAMEFDKERFRERISKLGSGVGYIRVGGATELEIEEKRAKIDDAINAVKAALKDGGIPGGGVMLLRASNILDDNIRGESILKKAIQKPFETIISNADYDVEEVKKNVLASEDINYGFNVETEEYANLVDIGIIDPALVAKTALQNAVSIAELLMTVDGANTLLRKPDDK